MDTFTIKWLAHLRDVLRQLDAVDEQQQSNHRIRAKGSPKLNIEIVTERARVLLLAVTDVAFYPYLTPEMKARVDKIDGREPASRTQEDCLTILIALSDTTGV